MEQHAEPKTVLSPALDAPVDVWPDLSEPVFAKPHKSTSELTEALPNLASNKPEASHATKEAPTAPGEPKIGTEDGVLASSEPLKESIREADNALFQIFSAKNSEFDEEPKSGRNKRLIVVAAGAGAILLPLILMISLGHHGTKAAVRVPVQTAPAATDTPVVTDAPEISTSGPSSQDKPSAATKKEQASDTEPAQKEDASNSSQPASELQTQMMNDQLTAPRMISGDMKQVAESAPPPSSLGSSAAEGLGGGAIANVFDGHTQPIVKAARPIAISSGVATGMLIQRTPPIYPTIAKAARVSGTVELQATISKNGSIKDAHVVSGPVMLRQSALDAVRTWRYKPYKLNNEPTEVETMVNVVFTLGN